MHSRVSYQRSCDLPRIPLTRRQEYTPREDLIKYVRRPRSELAHTYTHVSHAESSLRACESRVIRGGCRSGEEKSNLSTNSVSFQVLTGEGSIGSKGRVSRTEKTPRPRMTLRKFHEKFREKCIDIRIWYFDNKDESVRTDSINVILYSITANDIVLSMRLSILLLNSMSRNQYFSNCTTNIMYNKCVESGPIDTMLSLDRMLNNSYNIDTSLKRARART